LPFTSKTLPEDKLVFWHNKIIEETDSMELALQIWQNWRGINEI
jgi:hypothetical protein